MTTPAPTPISPGRYQSALKELPDSVLFTEITRLSTALEKLQESNREMEEHVEDEDCVTAVRENMVTIGRFETFREMVRGEMRERGLVGEGSGEGHAVANGVKEEEVRAAEERIGRVEATGENGTEGAPGQRPAARHGRTLSELTIRENAPSPSPHPQAQANTTTAPTSSTQTQGSTEEEGVYL